MMNFLKSFVKEEDGATIVEYVIMLAVIAGIVMFAFPNLRSALTGWLSGMFTNVGGGIGKTTDMELTCPDGTTKVANISDCP